ncbi:MAG: SdpI family protein [Crocinitomicaceae bacterium]
MNLKKELPLIAVVLLPVIYLVNVWNILPSKVPMHWGSNGDIDRYGSKTELAILVLLLPIVTYLLFLVIPKLDPKKKLEQMGGKFQSIKFLLTLFMAVLSLFIIYSAKNESAANPNYIILLIGVLFIVLGNFFKTIKANYFLGIRTPWTLENETVWKETHKMAGVMWFIGGILVVFLSMILSKQANLTAFLIITGIITLVPMAYSYFKFKELNK